jgi:hypothetical protein
MPRPNEYSSVGRTVIHGGNISHEWIYHLYVIDEYRRIERYEGNEKREELIYTPSKVHIFLNEQTQTIARGGFSPDAAGKMPTYEDILTLEQHGILDAEHLRDEGYVRIRAEIGTLEIEYLIGLESGLLIKATAHQDEEPAWEFELLELKLERPEDDKFLLPSGAYVWEIP